MPFIECPNCRKRHNVPAYTNDFVCNCSDAPIAGSVVSYEDIPLTGKWIDYTGSSSDPSLNVNVQAFANKLEGTRAWEIEGIKLDDKTARGNNVSTTRTRPRNEYIQIK